MTPYGQSGPQSELTGFDFTAFYALGGVMGLMGDPNDKLMRAGNESYRTGARDRLPFLAMRRRSDACGSFSSFSSLR